MAAFFRHGYCRYPVMDVLNANNGGKTFSAQLGAGYATKYISRGLAREFASDHVIPLAVGAYQLNNQYSLIGGLKYQWLTDNGLEHNDSGICDEGSAILGVSRKFGKSTIAALSYQFVHGGIPGSFNIHNTGNNSGFPAFSHNRPEEHSFVLDIHHDFGKGLENFFWDCRVQYTFRWMTGWWFTNTLGYRYDVNKSTSVIVAGTWNATAGYFDSNSLNANGTQGISLTVSTPVKATKDLTVTPFVGTVWLGNGGLAANHRGASARFPYREPSKVYRNFTFVAGQLPPTPSNNLTIIHLNQRKPGMCHQSCRSSFSTPMPVRRFPLLHQNEEPPERRIRHRRRIPPLRRH